MLHHGNLKLSKVFTRKREPKQGSSNRKRLKTTRNRYEKNQAMKLRAPKAIVKIHHQEINTPPLI